MVSVLQPAGLTGEPSAQELVPTIPGLEKLRRRGSRAGGEREGEDEEEKGGARGGELKIWGRRTFKHRIAFDLRTTLSKSMLASAEDMLCARLSEHLSCVTHLRLQESSRDTL
jgi:hypothetical protein